MSSSSIAIVTGVSSGGYPDDIAKRNYNPFAGVRDWRDQLFRRAPATVRLLGLLLLVGCLGGLSPGRAIGAPAPESVERIYVLYCGELHISDVSPWTPGANAGQPAVFSDNCYLIRHRGEWMLWDTGLPEFVADLPEGMPTVRGMRLVRKMTLLSQLQEIGVAPSDIHYLALSHFHPDHAGNGNLFTNATLYIQQKEFDAAFGSKPVAFGYLKLYDNLRNNKTVKLDGDYDVFGDGSVVILSTPGHTPGHQSLLVRLPKTGPVILSGDVAHSQENFTLRRVPTFNFDAAETKASMDKIASIMAREHAQLWVNHDEKQTETMALAPNYIQ